MKYTSMKNNFLYIWSILFLQTLFIEGNWFNLFFYGITKSSLCLYRKYPCDKSNVNLHKSNKLLILEYKSLSLCSIWIIQFVSTTYTIVVALQGWVFITYIVSSTSIWPRKEWHYDRDNMETLDARVFWEIFILEALIINCVISCIDGYKGSGSRLFSMKVQKAFWMRQQYRR